MNGPKNGIDPIDAYVGGKVRQFRIARGVSQEKLGDAIDLTFQQVQKYEKGTNRISASRLVKIAVFLDVPVAEFFAGAPGTETIGGGEPLPELTSRFVTTREGFSIAAAFDKMNPDVRKAVVALASEIAGTNQEMEAVDAAA